MEIEHLAIWGEDLELLKTFYCTYFGMSSGEKYHNLKKGFTSYFLTFGEGKTRIELMHRPDIEDPLQKRGSVKGITHFAVSVGSKGAVDELTERLRAAGYVIEGEPRTTGDGFYESVILDPEGNVVEITE